MKNVGQDIDIASKEIKEGKLVVFPTETVYGIGASAFNSEAVENIFKAKNRPADNPLIVHISNMEMLKDVAESVNDIERKIMEKFWPGPISIVLKKNKKVPDVVTANLDTVSVRMPDNSLALNLIEKAGPIAAPSANVSGKPSGTNIDDIYSELSPHVSYFIDGGNSNIGIESTVVKVDGGKVIILRPGYVTMEDLKSICKNVEIDKNCFNKVDENEKVLSPGMKHKHYAPNAKCVLLKYEDEGTLLKNIDNLVAKDKKVAFMFLDCVASKLKIKSNMVVFNLGKNLEDVARNIFKMLREIDVQNIDICYIQSFEKKGLGLGIMNRLIRVCDYNIIDIKEK